MDSSIRKGSVINYNKNESLKIQNKNLKAEKDLMITKKGVVTNTFINHRGSASLILGDTSLPVDLTKKRESQDKSTEKRLFSMIGAPLGVLGAAAVVTGIMAGIFKRKVNSELLQKNTPNEAASKILTGVKRLFTNAEKGPVLPPQLAITTETQFATYEALRDPSLKRMLGAAAVFTFSAAAFVLKNTVDGFKEIWVKQKDADIQRNFQEKMINIETRSFSGKKQVIRYILDKKSTELDEINKSKNISFTANKDNGAFSSDKTISDVKQLQSFQRLHKKGDDYHPNKKEDKSSTKNNTGIKPLHILIGAAAIASSVFLIKSTIKNIRKIGKTIEVAMEKIPEQSSQKTSSSWAPAHQMLGDPSGKPTIYGILNDPSAYLYNMIMNPGKFTGIIFAGISAVAGTTYAGSKFVEANKEVEVKKAGAEIDLDMHDKLVKVELKNFMTKKEVAVNPLIQEYKIHAKNNTGDKEGLKSRYNGVLDEIKNGPPFVYD